MASRGKSVLVVDDDATIRKREVFLHVVRGHDRPRVVVVTGVVADAPAHLQPFVDAVVAKPFDPRELVGVCNRLTSAGSVPRRPLLR